MSTGTLLAMCVWELVESISSLSAKLVVRHEF